ncbi:DUF6191 domain-containing protein [Kitasatospora sp. NPDC087861]|uniref:DUF6191 domain-containing protein n=1 Tax=unclassified Kitasatospora TaxID=2633591 RepID=UPI002475E0B2|nr:DUF6191 domain-containing protein [Kitasatospora sp. MAA19]
MGVIVGVASAVAAVLGLVLLAVWQIQGESSGRRRPDGGSTGVGLGGGLEELHALFSPGKQVQIEQRREQLTLRDDAQAGAPPHFGVDLDRGVAVLRGGGGTAGPDRERESAQAPQPREQSTSR